VFRLWHLTSTCLTASTLLCPVVLKQRRLFRVLRNGVGRPGRKLLDFLPCLLPGDADVVGALQVKPELRARAEPVPEPKGGVAGDAATAVKDLRHAIGRDVDLPRKLGRRDAKLGRRRGFLRGGWRETLSTPNRGGTRPITRRGFRRL
jgi:hypothetical protein